MDPQQFILPTNSSSLWNPDLGGNPDLDPNTKRRAMRKKLQLTEGATSDSKPLTVDKRKLCVYGIVSTLRTPSKPCQGYYIRCTSVDRQGELGLDKQLQENCLTGNYCQYYRSG
jgi:hypothetical protein